MKASMFLSRVSAVPTPTAMAEVVADTCAKHTLCANVTPMYSSVHAKKLGDYRVEPGVRIDLLNRATQPRVLLLWESLRKRFESHCVWLDFEGTPGVEDYHGCICEWPFYIKHYRTIDHPAPLTCSEY